MPIIQKTYDLIKWYIPILNRLPRNYRFALGDRMSDNLYDLLEGLVRARYAKSDKLARLQALVLLGYAAAVLLSIPLLGAPSFAD